ncbi:glycosyltransferase family 4 protein [Bacteroidia bacterium]|nr:glycosyltransferase family 4 protein [Bacteroidia bacterium]
MRKKVLVSAYACSPYHGSEAALGWNYIYWLNKTERYTIHVVVEQEKWQSEIEMFLSSNKLDNVSFFFVRKKRARLLRKLWPPSYYWFYRMWQKDVYGLVKSLYETHNYDVIHQLNMVGFREPGFLYNIDTKIIWGPVGGVENTPWPYVGSMSLYYMLFYTGRNLINTFQLRWLRRPRKMARSNNVKVISATLGTAKIIKDLWGVDSEVIPEVGLLNEELIRSETAVNMASGVPRIVWNGQLVGRKNLRFLIKVLAGFTENIICDVIGDGPEGVKLKKMASNLPANIQINWHGQVTRTLAVEIMADADLFVFTSVTDLTSTVVLEALSLSLPVLTLDYGGYGEIINGDVGYSVSITRPSRDLRIYRLKLRELINDRKKLGELSENARELARSFDWSKKVDKYIQLYES